MPLVLLILALAVCCRSHIVTQSKIMPQIETSDLNRAVSIALSKFTVVRKSTQEHKPIDAELVITRGKPVWWITCKPAEMIPDGSQSGVTMDHGGEVFVIVNLETEETKVLYG